MTNREIDALVAEHVMGAAVCRCDHTQTVSPRFDGKTGGCLSCGKMLGGSYSTDPAASKQSRDRMRELGWQWGIRTAANGEFRCEIYKLPSTVDVYFESFSATEEMAFALAALSTLGVEVPQ